MARKIVSPVSPVTPAPVTPAPVSLPEGMVKGRGRKPQGDNWKEVETICSVCDRLSMDNYIKHSLDKSFYDLKFGRNNWKFSIKVDYENGIRNLNLIIYRRVLHV